MSRSQPWVTQNFRLVLQLLKVESINNNGGFHRNSLIISQSNLSNRYWKHPAIQFLSTTSNSSGVKNVNVQPPPGQPSPSPGFPFPNWLRWVLASVVSLLLPFWTHNWQTLKTIEGEAEMVEDDVEKMADIIEEVADMAEKVAEDIAENLPQDSKLKEAALVVENLSKEAAHDAHLTQEFIHKVDEVKNQLLNDLESFVEPIIDNLAKKESERG